MKRAIWGTMIVILGILCVAVVLTVTGRSTRKTETEHALAEAIDSTMSGVMQDMSYTLADKDQFIADFLESLLVQLDSKSDVKVSILEADAEKGILSVEVTEIYKHPNGKTGTVSAVRTVIFDQEQEEEPEYCTVNFYTADNELYKSYTLPKGQVCTIPVPPQKDGKNFRQWQFVTGSSGMAEETQITDTSGGSLKTVLASGGNPYKVKEDTKLVAVFE